MGLRDTQIYGGLLFQGKKYEKLEYLSNIQQEFLKNIKDFIKNHSDISNIADISEIFQKFHLIFKYLKEVFKFFRGLSKD